MTGILHITQRQLWQQATLAGLYRADSLDSEGFIHCSTPQQIVGVANAFFQAQTDLVLLCIDSERVQAPIHFEAVMGGEQFPHIYGPLNLDAVMEVLDFEPNREGQFELPSKLVCVE